jgi:hypothetical protein
MKKFYALVFPIVGIGLALSAFSPKAQPVETPYDQAFRALMMYAADFDDIYPRAQIPGSSNRPLFPYPAETATGWWATREPAEVGSLWANAIVPYAKTSTYLELPGLPDFVRPGQTVDPTKPQRKAAITFNGLLQSFGTEAVPHPGLVPLYWTGFGARNIVNNAGVNPSMICQNVPAAECVYRPASTGSVGGEPTTHIQGVMFAAMSGLPMAEGDTDFTHFLMADGSLKRVRLGLKQLPNDPQAKGIHTLYANDGTASLWTDGRSFAWHFRPDRAEDDFGSGD